MPGTKNLSVKLALAFILSSPLCFSQRQFNVDLGANYTRFFVRYPYPLTTFGGHVGARVVTGKFALGLGVELAGTNHEAFFLPVYFDLRYALVKNLQLILQPGLLNYLDDKLILTIENPYQRIEFDSKAGFYGGLGLNYFVPIGKIRLHVLAKCARYTFKTIRKDFSSPTTFIRTTGTDKRDALTVGLGITL